MLKKILGTLSTKVFSGILNFILFMLTAQLMGASGRGEISLFITNIALIVLICNIIGGSALVFLTSRYNIFQLALPSYIWSVVGSIIASGIIIITGQTPAYLSVHLIILSVISGITSVNTMILLGKEQIKHYNLIMLGQNFILFIALFFFIFISKQPAAPIHYVYACYVAFLLTLFLSFIYARKYLQHISFSGFRESFKTLLKMSATAQAANIIQFFNYRISYYFLHHYSDLKSIGIFSTGMALAESIWIISNSIALVQYTRIANSTDHDYAIQLSFRLSKLSLWICTLAILPLLIMPSAFFRLLFGPEFGEVPLVILTLFAGVVSLGTSSIFSHYFSGLGQYLTGTIASIVGLIVIIPSCMVLIPKFGILGAGMAASLSYLASFLYFYYCFSKATGFSFFMLIPTTEDYFFLKETILNKYVRNSGDI